MTEWISVDEEMPEQFKCVLAYNEYGEYWTGAYNRDWEFFCDNEEIPYVTHWQPLPEPPQ